MTSFQMAETSQNRSAFALNGPAYLLALDGGVKNRVTLRRPQCEAPNGPSVLPGTRVFTEHRAKGAAAIGERHYRQW